MSDLVLWIREYQRTKDEIFLKNIIEQFEPAIRKAVFYGSQSVGEKRAPGAEKIGREGKKEGLNGKAPAVSCEGSLVEIIY